MIPVHIMIPKLERMPKRTSAEGSVTIEFVEGIPMLRASKGVQEHIEALLGKRTEDRLSKAEEEELNYYAEIDDYLSYLNRVVRNMFQSASQ